MVDTRREFSVHLLEAGTGNNQTIGTGTLIDKSVTSYTAPSLVPTLTELELGSIANQEIITKMENLRCTFVVNTTPEAIQRVALSSERINPTNGTMDGNKIRFIARQRISNKDGVKSGDRLRRVVTGGMCYVEEGESSSSTYYTEYTITQVVTEFIDTYLEVKTDGTVDPPGTNNLYLTQWYDADKRILILPPGGDKKLLNDYGSNPENHVHNRFHLIDKMLGLK